MFKFLSVEGIFGQVESISNGIFLILPIFGVLFLAILIFIVVVVSKNIKSGKKPHVFKYDNHELQVFVSMTRVEVFYDGKIVDEMAISNAAGATFNEMLDGVHYKINVGYSGITPSVIVFANNEKLASIK